MGGVVAARYGVGHPRAGQRIYEVDGKYMREVFALGVEIENMKAAEASRPQINPQQLDQLAWLERARGAVGKDGKPLSQAISPEATLFRKNLHAVHVKLLEGGDISTTIADTETVFAQQGVKLGAAAVDQSAVIQQRIAHHVGGGLPPASATHLGGGAIISERTK